MRFNKLQKILISFFLIIFLFSIFYFLFFDKVWAAKGNISCSNALDKYNYPWCNDAPKNIADLVGKFYKYALAAVGVAALGAIIYGGILHTVSAGNPSGQSEAKAWIWGAVSGVALLLGASLLLNTINPELVKLKDPGIDKIMDKIEFDKNVASSTNSAITKNKSIGATTKNNTSTTYDYVVDAKIYQMYNSAENCAKQGKSIYGDKFAKSQFNNNICTITVKE